MSSHPDTDARISNLQAKIVARGKSEVTPLSLTWETVKEAGCLPVHHSDPDKGVEMAAPE
jgi:PIN domain nuclease of toxin-antitoxin system